MGPAIKEQSREPYMVLVRTVASLCAYGLWDSRLNALLSAPKTNYSKSETTNAFILSLCQCLNCCIEFFCVACLTHLCLL